MLLASIDGRKAAFRISPVAEHGKPTVLCIHCSGGDSSVWSKQLAGLAADCTLIAPDLPGHGKTEGRGGYTVEAYASWLEIIIKAMGIKSCIVMGYSIGGAIAQAFARAYPALVQGLVLVSTAMRFDIAPHYLQVLKKDFPRAARASIDSAYAPGAAPELSHRGLQMLLDNGADAMYGDVYACTQFDSTAWMDTITAPSLIISGHHDPIAPPEAGAALAEALPQAEFSVFPGSSHMVLQEEADAFNARVRMFLKTFETFSRN
jgi:pimeloyl-ACP methyl ester carboxylesterase